MNGLVFTVKQQEVCVKGSLLLFLADTLAAHQIGGYKIGVGFALRKCRNCLATSDDINEKVSIKINNNNHHLFYLGLMLYSLMRIYFCHALQTFITIIALC